MSPSGSGRFNGVYLQDGTVISLPACLAEPWPASSKRGQEAAMRVQARVELARGQLEGLWLQEARAPERSGPAITTPLPAGSLFNGDRGYFTLQEMRRGGQQGQYWMTQAKATLCILDEEGHGRDLLSFLAAQQSDRVEVQVRVGKQDRLPMRLMAVRVSPEEAKLRRERANKQITHPPKGCQAQIPGKRKLKASSAVASPSAKKSVPPACA